MTLNSFTGIVSDNAPDNQALWKVLGVSTADIRNVISHFCHPVTNDKIWVFSDLPHLVKLLRNNVMDHGITLKTGAKLNHSDFERLLQLDGAELKICHKLSKKHINCKNRERMRVHLAFEVFSNNVAVAMRRFFPHKQEAANFVELINNCGDILNSRHPVFSSNNPYKVSFGVSQYETEQINKLMELFEIICKMRVGKSKSLYPFQRGFLLTINSAIHLLRDLKTTYVECQYILTARLNQDYIENFFFLIRGIGEFNMNPNPTETMTRLKAIALSQNLRHSQYLCVQNENSDAENQTKLASFLFDLEEDKIDNLGCTENSTLQTLSLNSDTWMAYNSNLTYKESCELGGQEYVAGFIASKLVSKHPELVLPMKDLERLPKSWTQQLSHGNLTVPIPEWVSQFINMDKAFNVFHQRAELCWTELLPLDPDKNVITRLSAVLSSHFSTLPLKLVKSFAKTRTMIRVSHNNKIIKNQPFYNFTAVRTRSHKSCLPDEMTEELLNYEISA